MLLSEITNDPDMRSKQLASALANMHDQNRPRKYVSPDDQKVRDFRRKDFEDRRSRVETALEQIAQHYKGSEFEAFKQEAESHIAAKELALVDIAAAFRKYNPEAQAAAKQEWDNYGKDRNASADAGGNNPMIHGYGPTGQRNWTGD